MNLNSLRKDISKIANAKRAKVSQRFFKTAKGEYGEGDIFIGITVPDSRKLAKKYSSLSLKEVNTLLKSKVHEERLIGLLILIQIYNSSIKKEEIVDFYLNNTSSINNWDLVDLSADKILGDYLFDKNKKELYLLAKSKNLWERRISIVSTYYFIKNGRFQETLDIAEILLKDKEDLIQKATGWMLREIGKRDIQALESFLLKNYKAMPRTMLRYSIERFPEHKRKDYLNGKI